MDYREAEWNVVLTPAEIECLFEGVSPLAVKPEHLVYYNARPYAPHFYWCRCYAGAQLGDAKGGIP